MTQSEEIKTHHATTATSHLTQALNWHRFALGIIMPRAHASPRELRESVFAVLNVTRRQSLARCVELYAREAGRCARCSGQAPELWLSKAPQAIAVHAIHTAFLAGWQECDALIADVTSESTP